MVMACAVLVAAPVALWAQASSSAGGAAEGAAAGSAAEGSATTATPAPPTDETTLIIPGGDTAAVSATTTPATTQVPGVRAWDFIRMLLILAAVVGVIYLLFWLLRRGAGRRVQGNELIKVLGSRTLSGSRALHLVEVGRSVYLVGSAEGGVELIAEVTDQESIDSIRLAAAQPGAIRPRSFADTLGEIFRPGRPAGGGPPNRPTSLFEGAGFLKRQRDRLRKLRGGGP